MSANRRPRALSVVAKRNASAHAVMVGGWWWWFVCAVCAARAVPPLTAMEAYTGSVISRNYPISRMIDTVQLHAQTHELTVRV